MTDHKTAARRHSQTLALWFHGVETQAIADALNFSSPGNVRRVIAEMRKRGDERAVLRKSGRRPRTAT